MGSREFLIYSTLVSILVLLGLGFFLTYHTDKRNALQLAYQENRGVARLLELIPNPLTDSFDEVVDSDTEIFYISSKGELEQGNAAKFIAFNLTPLIEEHLELGKGFFVAENRDFYISFTQLKNETTLALVVTEKMQVIRHVRESLGWLFITIPIAAILLIALAIFSIRMMTQRITENSFLREDLDLILSSTHFLAVTTDANHQILWVNKGLLQTLGYSKQELLNSPVEIFFDTAPPLGDGPLDQFETVWLTNLDVGIPVLVNGGPIHTRHGVPEILYIAHQIDQLKEKESRLRFQAEHDSLTGLFNRRIFLEVTEIELARAKRHRRLLGLLAIDLDNFKEINDLHGHSAGDAVLIEVASRFSSYLRKEDLVCRTGGDEFFVLLTEVSEVEDVALIAAKLLDALSVPFEYKGKTLSFGASIGIVCYPMGGDQVDLLIRHADQALYYAKESGKGHYRFFSHKVHSRHLRILQVGKSLDEAIPSREFSFKYQPIIDLETGTPFALEALMRWNSPTLGECGPEEFIAIAESRGQIHELGRYGLETITEHLATWRSKGIVLPVTFNVSPIQIASPHFLDAFEQSLKRNDLKKTDLLLELTESVLKRPDDELGTLFDSLTKSSITVLLDDFAKELSVLRWIRKPPICALKIDRSYVSELGKLAETDVIIKAISALAHALELYVIAAGIETKEQADLLREYGVKAGQGFFYSQPLSPKQILEQFSP